MRKPIVGLFVVLQVALSAPHGAAQAGPEPATSDAVARLERELAELRREYTERLTALEERIRALSVPAPAASPPAAVAEPAPVPVPAGSSKVFNPDIAVIGNFMGSAGRNRLEPEKAPLELPEAEASFQAVVDPYARGDFFFAFSPEGVEVEEGFLTFQSLPGKLLLKVGQMREGFGKVNGMHSHVLPWADRPLVAQNFLGGDEGLADAGLSLARLIPIGSTFVEATGEVYSGTSTVFQAQKRQDLSYVGRLRAYRDLSEAANLDVGGSFAYGHNGQTENGTTKLFGVDATFRYRPLRRALYRRFIARSELLWSRAAVPLGEVKSFGGYLSGEYQFARRWFAGARFDLAGRPFDTLPNDKGGSLLLTFWPSEFSQIRGQWRYTKHGLGGTSHEAIVQLLFAIGAHGAHSF